MSEQHDSYEVVPFPVARRMIVDGGRMSSRHHPVHGLIEVDVTDARRLIREHKAKTGEALSFTAFVITCLGRAVETNKYVHACRDWRGRLVLFDEVNVNTAIEIERDARKTHHAHVIRAANRRTFREIHDEIRAFQAGGVHSPEGKGIRQLAKLPRPLRLLFYWTILHKPKLQHRAFGTLSLTAVGMFGKGGGWAIPFTLHSLGVALGGIAEKPGVVDGQIEIREYLCVTLTFDHDVVDGAPAARFAQQFKELIESCYGLGKIAGEKMADTLKSGSF